MMVQSQEEMGEEAKENTEVPQPSGPTINVADEAAYEEMDDSLERAATTATSLDAEKDRGNIDKTQSKATLNEPSSLGTSSGSGPRRQETMGDTIAQTRFENVSKTSNDSLLAGKLFDKAIKRVNKFVDMDTELVEGSEVRVEGNETRVEGSSKRAGEDLEQESSKK
ncbi:hypothetical protein Tco_0337387 [Tanacetum coccineum]